MNLCEDCKRYQVDCPLHGMTDTMENPLEGFMSTCIYYLPFGATYPVTEPDNA